jgi:hypothetical protein
MRIAVCAPQVPFVHGGAEILAETLVRELRERDHEADLVTVPFKWYPGTRVLDQAFLWRLLDLKDRRTARCGARSSAWTGSRSARRSGSSPRRGTWPSVSSAPLDSRPR